MRSKNKIISLSLVVAASIGGAWYFYSQSNSPIVTQQSVSVKEPKAQSTPEMAVLPKEAIQAPAKKVTKTKPAEEIEEEEDVLSLPDDNPNFATFNDRYQHIVARRAGQTFDPQELYKAMQEPDTWTPTDEAPASFNLSDSHKNDGRVFINLSAMKLETMARGDKINIKIPNTDIDFMATINDVRSDNAGSSVTWEGSSDTPNSNNKITITKGDTLVVGGIFTDENLYQIEVKDGQGYIVSNATLFRHGQDQTVEVPQYLIDNPPDEYVELEAETHGG